MKKTILFVIALAFGYVSSTAEPQKPNVLFVAIAAHTCNNLPMIVAGGGYRHQTHTVLEKPTPLCNLYVELLHKHNIDAAKFGSSQKDMGLLKG